MAAPPNDLFADRQVLSGVSGSVGPVDITDATSEPGEPTQSCGADPLGPYQTIWYEWTPEADGAMSFDTFGSVDGDALRLDTVISVYTGAALGSLVEIACNDDFAGHGFNSKVTFAAAAGTTYLIQVGTYGGELVGTVLLNWNQDVIVTPANDSCGNARELVGCSGTVVADNRGWDGVWPVGDDPLFNANGDGGGAPLWFKWTNTKARRILFRVIVNEPPDNAVDYNFGMGIGSCGSLVFADGDSFDMDAIAREGGTWDGHDAAECFGPEFETGFDIVVDPGHTVFFELDSCTGDTSEPPTAGPTERGKFQFDWSALEYTDYDTTQGSQDAEPSETSSVLVDPVVSPMASGAIQPYSTLIHDGRLYLLFINNEAFSDSVWAADCALDGTDFHSQRVWDASTGSPGTLLGGIASIDPGGFPQLFTDGTDVFVGYGWVDPISIPNPDYTGSKCADYAGLVYLCNECADGANQVRYNVFVFNSGSHGWDELYSIGAPGSESMVPDMSYMAGHDFVTYGARACASDAQPGKVWVHAVYIAVRVFQTLHFNDYPLFGGPGPAGGNSGSYWCTNDKIEIWEFADTFEIDVAGATCTTHRVSNRLGEIQHWDHDDPGINPAFAEWQFFADGDWVTDTTTHRTAIFHSAYDIKNDDGFPVLAAAPPAYAVPDSGNEPFYSIGNDIEFLRPDTGAVLGTWSYDDVVAGFESDSTFFCTKLALTGKFTDPDDGIGKRGLATYWNNPPATAVRTWTAKIKSDGTTTPEWIVPGFANSSGNAFFGLLFPDTVPGQWWAQNGPNLGFAVGSGATTFYLWEDCDGPSWFATYSGRFGPDGLGGDYLITPLSAYDEVGEDWYFLNAKGQLRKAHVLRDYIICEPGSPCAGFSLHVKRRHYGGG